MAKRNLPNQMRDIEGCNDPLSETDIRQWLHHVLDIAADGSIVFMPLSQTGFCVNRKHKSLSIAFGPDNLLIRRMIETEGWKVYPCNS